MADDKIILDFITKVGLDPSDLNKGLDEIERLISAAATKIGREAEAQALAAGHDADQALAEGFAAIAALEAEAKRFFTSLSTGQKIRERKSLRAAGVDADALGIDPASVTADLNNRIRTLGRAVEQALAGFGPISPEIPRTFGQGPTGPSVLEEFNPADAAEAAKAAAERTAQVRRILAVDDDYIIAQAQIVEAKALEQASVRSLLVASDDYVKSLAQTKAANQQIENSTNELLAETPGYVSSLARARILREQENVQVQELLAKQPLYTALLGRAQVLRAQENAQLSSLLAANGQYIEAQVASKAAQARQTAAIQEALANTAGYAQSLATTKVANQQIANQTQELLAITPGYIASLARARVLREQESARVAEMLVGNSQYTSALVRSKVAQLQIANQTQSSLAEATGYVSALARSKVLREQENVRVQETLAEQPLYTATLARAKLLREQESAEVQRLLSENREYVLALAKSKVAQASIQTALQQQLLNTAGYAQTLADGKIAQERLNLAVTREVQRQTLNDDALIRGKGEEAAARKLITSRIAAEAQASAANIAALETEALTRRRTAAAKVQAELGVLSGTATGLIVPGGGTQLTGAQAAATEAETKAVLASREKVTTLQAQIVSLQQQLGLQDAELVVSRQALEAAIEGVGTAEVQNALRGQLAVLTAQQKAATEAQTEALVAGGFLESEATVLRRQKLTTLARQISSLQQDLGISNAELAVSRQTLQEAIQGLGFAEAQNELRNQLLGLQAQENAVEARRVAALRASGALPPDGSGFLGTGRQSLLGTFGTTLRFGVASSVLFGLSQEISASVKEAAELEKIFNQIERQFQNLFEDAGPGEASRQFEAFRKSVFEIAELTGQAADEVATVGFQLQGAFGGDTQRAIQETRSAIIATRVTGLELTEVIDGFTALTQSFKDVADASGDVGVSIMDVSDTALALQEEFGVLAKETIKFAADLAPVGAGLGFTVQELETLGAAAQKFSGRSGAVLSEAFGRVLPQLQENASDIVALFGSLGGDVSSRFISAFQQGDIQGAFEEVLRNFNSLSETQQLELGDLIGGRRELQSIIGVLQNGQDVLAAWDTQLDATGKTSQYFADLQDTIQQKLARLDQQFRHLVQALYDSGLDEFFGDFIDSLSLVLSLLEDIFQLLGSIGGAAGSLGPLGEILPALIQGAAIFGAGRGIGGIFRKRRAAKLGVDPSDAAVQTRSIRERAVGSGQAYLKRFNDDFTGAVRSTLGSLAGPAVAIGAAYIASLDANVRRGAEAEAAAVASRLETEGEVEVLNQASRIGLSESDVARIRAGLASGTVTSRQVRELFTSEAEKAASGFQQLLDDLPFNLSADTANREAAGRTLANFLIAEVDSALDEAFELLGQNLRAGEMAARVIKAFDVDNLPDLSLPKTSDDPYGIQAFLDRLADPTAAFGGIEPSPTSTFGDLNLFAATSPDALIGEAIKNIIVAGFADVTVADLTDPAVAERLGPIIAATVATQTLGPDAKKFVEERLAALGGMKPENVAAALQQLQTGISSGEIEAPEGAEEAIDSLVDKVLAATKGLTDIQKKANEGYKSVKELAAGYESGDVTATTFISALEKQIAETSKLKDADSIAKVIELQGMLKDTIIGQVDRQVESYEAALDLGLEGSGGNVQGVVQKIEKLVTSDALDLSIAEEAELARKALEILRDQQERDAASISDAAQRRAFLAQNLTLPEALAEAALAEMIQADYLFTEALSAALGEDAAKTEGAVRLLAEIMVSTGATLAEAIEIAVANRKAMLAAIEQAIAISLQGLQGVAGTLAGIGSLSAADVEAFNQLATITQGFSEDLETIANETLGQLTGTTLFAGAGGGGNASDDVDDLARRIEEAKLNLLLAQVENDPLAAAHIARQQADIAYKYAENTAEQLNAQADAIRADRQIQDALFDITNSETELLIAKAEAAGRVIEASRLSRKAAEDALAQAKARGAGEAELNRLRADVYAARAAERDTKFNERLEDQQFLYEMGDITREQFASFLEGMLANADLLQLTKDQRRQLERQLKSLQDDVRSDLQFNLPSNLDLPTLYETRRFNQTGGMIGSTSFGGGGIDQRQITINISATDTAVARQVAEILESEVSGSPTYTTTRVI